MTNYLLDTNIILRFTDIDSAEYDLINNAIFGVMRLAIAQTSARSLLRPFLLNHFCNCPDNNPSCYSSPKSFVKIIEQQYWRQSSEFSWVF
ncbi:MAG: hypothetical protein V7K27_12420 [Nostoc sp.]|uniref:hypothetical protein n=1 Tax=Nostoc sp. TaxID=1180 RepID=UPI002FF9D5EC